MEPLAPSGSQLQSGMARPTKTASSERPQTSGSKDSAVVSVQAAVLSGRASLVRTAVKQCSANAALDSTDEQGLTPLLHAALTGAHDITAVLLKVYSTTKIKFFIKKQKKIFCCDSHTLRLEHLQTLLTLRQEPQLSLWLAFMDTLT